MTISTIRSASLAGLGSLLLACCSTETNDRCLIDLATIAGPTDLGVGDTATFHASLGPADCLPPDVTPPDWRWSSLDTLVATIDSLSGLARGVSPGTTTIQVVHARASSVSGTASLHVTGGAFGDQADIAFVQDGDLYSIASAGGAAAQRVAGGLVGPAWSPDGTQLAALDTVGQPALFLLSPDGSGVRRFNILDSNFYNVHGLSWRPDGQVLTFAAQSKLRTTPFVFIYFINADGTGPLASEAEGFDDLAWSPDGTLYTVTVLGGVIFVVDHSTLTYTRLASSACCADWSPDGATIAYAGNPAIHLIEPDRSNDRTLPGPSDDNADILPRWSPDGEKIAFATRNSVEGTFPRQVAGVMNADGTGRIALAPGIETNSAVDWSADGTLLAFTGFESAEDVAAKASRLYIVRPDGSDLHAIAGPAAICCAVWRP